MLRGLEVIERNVRAQTQLIDDLLDVSRIITGKLRLEVRPIDLAPVVEAAHRRRAARPRRRRRSRSSSTSPPGCRGCWAIPIACSRWCGTWSATR